MAQVRKWATAGLISAGVVVIFTAAAWACVSGPALTLSKSTAQAGEEIGISGTGWRFKADPVTIRFNALDGPVLATAPVQAGNFSTNIAAPEGTKPGNYVIIASQHAPDGSLSQQPARILLTVVGEAGATPVLGEPAGAPDSAPRPALATSDDSISGSTLVLIALGVAGTGMFLAGLAALVASRRSTAPEVARVNR